MCVGGWEGLKGKTGMACISAQPDSANPIMPSSCLQATARSCSLLTVCAAGEEVSVPASQTSDRVCRACEAEEYQDRANQHECRRATQCLVGESYTTAMSKTVNRVCAPCAAGSYQDLVWTCVSVVECVVMHTRVYL